ncbi:adenylosuccinate lyase [Maribacter cobaltidurans]|uniref:Adenylosuccinate lyase n=1 Tax=Maribacter cobaltidurans TaxID=1178778 RepID=A0A223V936_9FLAO|nr:adenylosuccinate lyase [Maribacter cobaltidurans]ASV31915.1 adenylosuccinate lyase [Maribacter cobaltidurans]GGD85623.1 hypothetical protein GCM10011412_24290 [Maribacter cobaltidurans]
MTKSDLYKALNYVDSSRKKRSEMAEVVLSNEDLIPSLIEIIHLEEDPISCKASWILEFAFKKRSSILYPYLDNFTKIITKVNLDSSVRPLAKICELLVQSYFSKKPSEGQKYIKESHLNTITTACFDWLIGEHKVAAKAYSMTSLFLLGQKFGWIHPELKMILEQNYPKGSAAYKARARMVLKKLN